MKITITITECRTNGRVWESAHKTDDPDRAVSLAIARHWGRRAGFYPDRGLNRNVDLDHTRYGQIGHLFDIGQATMDTGRVRIDIE
jgi:hypothetical protein